MSSRAHVRWNGVKNQNPCWGIGEGRRGGVGEVASGVGSANQHNQETPIAMDVGRGVAWLQKIVLFTAAGVHQTAPGKRTAA